MSTAGPSGSDRDDPLRPLKIVWAAMIGGTVAYTGLIYALVVAGVLDLAVFGANVVDIVGAVVILQLVGSAFLRRRLVAAIPDDAPAEERLARYGSANIVSLALMEGGGLFLITFALLAGTPTWILAGGAGAAVVMLLARPSGDELGG